MTPTFAFVGWSSVLPCLLIFLGIDALLVWRLARGDRQWRSEILALLLAQALAGWLVAAFFGSSHIGAGDSYHYGLQLADFLAQLRHGVFPVFVGQSEFGFNGNIHTVRTAPYYVHLGAVLNVLTAGRLPVFGLQNLCVIVSFLGGVTTAYAAVRKLAPEWRPVAPLLAALYLLCPAVMVILVGMDMYPTIMVLPWLPVFWLGTAGELTARNETRWLILATAALGLIWYAHPAIAAWLSPIWLGALAVRFFFGARGPGRWVRPLLAGVCLGWMVVFLFVSVATLKLKYSNNLHGYAAGAIFANLRLAWSASWRPLAGPIGNLGNIQLGYALALIWVACVCGIRRTGVVGIFFAAVSFGLVLLLLPLPPIFTAWSLMPDKLIDATNVWPMQRFYPIIAAALPVWAAVTLRTFPLQPKWRSALSYVLAAGVIWGVTQEKLPRDHALLVRPNPKTSATLMAPGNIRLGRVSYLFFGFYPSYYSHGVTEPAFETRLLDRDWRPLLDNASALYRIKSGAPPYATLTPTLIPTRYLDVKRREATFKTDGHSQYLLAFAFEGTPTGDFELIGNTLARVYSLPEFGEPKAFGAGPQSTHYLPISLPAGPPETILLRTEIPKLSARVFAFRSEELPIKTESLIPLTLSVDASQPAFVETPRVFIDGYHATVNGVDAPIIKSPDGLVAVAVSPGPARVVVSYPGPGVLRACFWLSFSGFCLLPLLGAWAWRKSTWI